MRWIFRLLLLPFRLAVFPWFRWRRARALPRGGYVHVELRGAVAEWAGPARFWQRFRTRPLSLADLRELAREIAADPRAKGLLVTIFHLNAGMATARSLRQLFASLRAQGKEVVVHLPVGADTKAYYVATAANRIYMGPRSALSPVGFATRVRYVREALSRCGLEAEVFAKGRYKSAGEQLTRDTMSEPQHEQLDRLVEVFYEETVDAIAQGRNLSRQEAAAAIDEAPHRADQAIAARLVEGALYEDELAAKLAAFETMPVPALDYLRARRRGASLRQNRLPRVGVVAVFGPIAEAPVRFGVQMATDDAVIAAIRAAREDRRSVGVVLHVDSPGGSALASDRIHHELTQLAREKPVVAYFGNVAASGGYYVGAAAHHIVAQPTTVTGSIGVVAARVVAESLLDRIGVRTESVRRGARAAMLDPAQRLGDDEREVMSRELSAIYDGFLRVVSEGRRRPMDEIALVAEGRVWMGKDALERGLVDELGGFDAAVRAVLSRAHVPGDQAALYLAKGRSKSPPLAPPPAAEGAGAQVLAALAESLGMRGLLQIAALSGLSVQRALLLCPFAALLE